MLHSVLLQELARRNLSDYARLVFGFEPAQHHEYWLSLLSDEHVKRLLIIAPPESAKSTYTSLVFPTWYLGHHPEMGAAVISCTATQAQEFGNVISQLVDGDDVYHSVFRHIQPDKTSGWSKDHIYVHRENKKRPDPTFLFTGMGGPVIGRRFDLVIVDDPTDQEIAFSDVQRERQKIWFKQTLLSRLVRGGRCIVILTRWHEDDLAAELMRPEMGFTVVHLPAFDGEGNSYWPEQWPVTRLEEKRREVGSHIFRCMYMGDPSDPAGNIIKRDWWRYYDMPPSDFQRVIHSWDTAFKGTRGADYSVCTVWGETPFGYYLLDLWRGKVEFPELKRTAMAMYDRDRPHAILVEDAASGQSLTQALQRDTRLPIIPVKADRDKRSRVHAISPLIESGRAYIPEEAPWVQDYVEEMARFPSGAHDDQVDSSSQALLWLSQPREFVRKVVFDAVAEFGISVDL